MKRSALLALAMLAAASARADDGAASIAEALTGGEAHVGVRLRYEGVDDGGVALDASAVTARTRLTWQSAPVGHVRAVLEVDDVRAAVEDYNSTSHGRTSRPIVADPTGTDLNRAALEWSSGTTQVAVGRQRLNWDDQRFIGSAAWRQNEQTFDGLTAHTRLAQRLDLSAGYLYQVNRVYGPENGSQAAEWHGQIELLRADWDARSAGHFIAFQYRMALHNALEQSTATTGLLWTATPHLPGDWTLPVSLSYASQSDAGDAPTPYSAHYVRAELGVARHGWSLKGGREVLSGTSSGAGRRFQTPLATLHAFQGWADRFLVTPARGIEDSYLTLSLVQAPLSAIVSWHDFRADAGSLAYGTEWDAMGSVKFARHYEVLLKVADYRARGFSFDSRKVWLMFSATY
jgi:hypothetical protein